MAMISRALGTSRIRVVVAFSAALVALSLITATASPARRLPTLRAPRVDGIRTDPGAFLSTDRPRSRPPVGALPARVVDATNVFTLTEEFRVLDENYKPIGTSKWRTVDGTGNCCENYITISPQGTLYDFGGDYIYFSVDEGRSWRQVRPTDPLPNFGEGTIAIAPNGDIVGVAWNPYYGDRVEPFKYSVEDEGWFYTHTKLHQPFYDRESVAVIPGPFNYQGQKFPYLSVLRGGWPLKSPWFYSFDGLNYFVPNSRSLDVITEQSDDPLKIEPDKMLDWIQPAEQSAITPLGKGKAISIAAGNDLSNAQFARLNKATLRWSQYEFPSGEMPSPGRLRIDSTGRLHYVTWKDKKFRYLLSTDGGKHWRSTKIKLPKGYEFGNDAESAVSGELGKSVITVHARNEKKETNQDFVYEFKLRGDKAKLKRIYAIGDGKGDYGVGITASGDRFDFPTIALFPDGSIAVSYANSQKGHPTLAIQLSR